jgi:acetolactate synthase-1/2/3 large subunit
MLGYPCTNTAHGFGRTYLPALKIFLGMLGGHGTVEANNAMQNCDLAGYQRDC